MTEEKEVLEQEEIVEEEAVEEERVETVVDEEIEVPTKVTVGEKEYELDKKGRSQAEQISNLISWLAKYGDNIAEEITDREGNVEVPTNTAQVLIVLNKVVSADALIDLFVVVTGCSEKEADEYFDIVSLIDGVVAVLSQDRYAKVINRFFSTG